MAPGVQVRIAEIRRGWVREHDGFLPCYRHRSASVRAVFVGGAPGVPAGFRWQLVGDARFDGRLFGRLASALLAVPAPALAFGGRKRVERMVKFGSPNMEAGR